MTLRVLHVGKYFPPHRGGMETFLRSLMAAQQGLGYETYALVHASKRSLLSTDETCEWQGQRLRITRVARWFTAAFVPVSPMFPWQLWRTIRRERPDVLELHVPNASAFWCLLIPSARRIPWVIHWQADVVPSLHKLSLRLLYSVYRLPERWLLQKAALITASSPPYLEASEPLQPFRDKCAVLPLGIEPLAPAEADTAPETEGDQQVHLESTAHDAPLKVLAVGRLTYYKGFSYLLKAVAAVPEVTLTLVGDGEDRELLLQLADKLGLDDRLRYLAGCDDHELLALYATHDVFCLPSIERTEAFGVVLLEAMRQGLPCIVTDVPGTGMRWVVDAPVAGMCVAPADVAALSEALQNLACARVKLATLGKAAQARFDTNFDITGCAGRLDSMVRQVLEN